MAFRALQAPLPAGSDSNNSVPVYITDNFRPVQDLAGRSVYRYRSAATSLNVGLSSSSSSLFLLLIVLAGVCLQASQTAFSASKPAYRFWTTNFHGYHWWARRKILRKWLVKRYRIHRKRRAGQSRTLCRARDNDALSCWVDVCVAAALICGTDAATLAIESLYPFISSRFVFVSVISIKAIENLFLQRLVSNVCLWWCVRMVSTII